ncbi:hypothetical protein BATDEDRAFT_21617 [Batrachochytrium dendrobatidis JAM81]|uniref:S-adenosyl-methyltransferase MraW n=1 Tax=Batrachochytrium dendrobatidis (strain JAM81 / FGSC 10211) TaxID=684364 RepID=F4NU46_BATDJ|nr:uncharacterized protein BATDEDRAFT_21617 [Batrachochytrium dendrobatidis JAM81]EGF83167.1 hypothetical protein BATDEDRAFT_21617 [Batrachochytrium dendrobatidis JAM81]|eukprot:XP_006675334.1 hypothetical protein BATDEDRAFT_21617 [Batrachochytrium dendrobatidis JAM81]
MNITMRLQQRLLKHCNAFCPAKNLLQLSYLLHPIIQKQSISTLNPSSITKPDHKPVLLVPVVDILSPEFDLQSRERQSQRVRFQRPRLICDATFGNGGYTKALLDKMDCKVFCVDQDPLAIERAMDMSLKPEYKNRLIPIHGKFSDIQNLIAPYTASHEACLDGIVFDIGISSNQLDDASRGFSFRKDGPLDYPEMDLVRILQQYGEEKNAYKIVRMIAAIRSKTYINTTTQLAQIIAKAVGKEEHWQQGHKHPAMKTIRIYINDELKQLQQGLVMAERLLKPDGRCVVVTFHSLEDRIVKRFFQACAQGVTPDELPPPMTQQESRRESTRVKSQIALETAERKREQQDRQRVRSGFNPDEELSMDHYTLVTMHDQLASFSAVKETGREPSMIPLSKKAIVPDEKEMQENSRSRSAKLRAARRTNHPTTYTQNL